MFALRTHPGRFGHINFSFTNRLSNALLPNQSVICLSVSFPFHFFPRLFSFIFFFIFSNFFGGYSTLVSVFPKLFRYICTNFSTLFQNKSFERWFLSSNQDFFSSSFACFASNDYLSPINFEHVSFHLFSSPLPRIELYLGLRFGLFVFFSLLFVQLIRHNENYVSTPRTPFVAVPMELCTICLKTFRFFFVSVSVCVIHYTTCPK